MLPPSLLLLLPQAIGIITTARPKRAQNMKPEILRIGFPSILFGKYGGFFEEYSDLSQVVQGVFLPICRRIWGPKNQLPGRDVSVSVILVTQSVTSPGRRPSMPGAFSQTVECR